MARETYKGWSCYSRRHGVAGYAAFGSKLLRQGLKAGPFTGEGAQQRALDELKRMVDAEETVSARAARLAKKLARGGQG